MNASNKIRILQFNVGAGDHLVLELPDGSIGVVDFHYSKEQNWGKPPIWYYLNFKKEQCRSIFLVNLSHYDTDHIKGLTDFHKLIQTLEIPIENVWLAGDKEKDSLKQLLLSKILEYQKIKKNDAAIDNIVIEDIEMIQLLQNYKNYLEQIDEFVSAWRKKSDKFEIFVNDFKELSGNIGVNIRAYSIAPLDRHIEKYRQMDASSIADILLFKRRKESNTDRNLISSIFFLEHKKFRWCFGGDASQEVWEDSLKEIGNRKLEETKGIASDFIKVSHHGSKKSSSPLIWENLTKGKKKSFFGISAGKKYQHPSFETLEHIKDNSYKNNINSTTLSTNSCDDCNNNLNLEEINMNDWTEAVQLGHIYRKSRPDIDIAMKPYRSKEYKNWNSNINQMSNEKGLVAYVYDFDLTSGEVEIFKGVSKYISSTKACPFYGKTPCPKLNFKV